MKKAFVSFIVVFWLLPFYSIAQLDGVVFIDTNGNGKMDANEKGLEGAVLSDGLNVVRSGADGSFQLEGWEKERFVTLYRGGNYSCVDYYIPIHPETRSYQFAVQSSARENAFSFVQISDTETFEFRDWVDHLRKYIRVHSPAFLVHTGDICYRSGIKWHAKNITQEKMGVPVYYCLGNHDLIEGDYGEQFFESQLGPSWYAFEEGNTLFVVTPMMHGDFKPGFTREEIGAWLKNLLEVYERSKPKFFFNHDLLTSGEKFEFTINADESIVLNDYNIKAWGYGHHHRNMVKKHGPQGIVSFGTFTVKGGIDHSASAIRIIEVEEDGDVSSHMRWFYLHRNMEIISPMNGWVRLNPDGEGYVSVNIYDSGARVDSVKYGIWDSAGFNWESSLDDSKWHHMHQRSDWNWSASFNPENTESHEIVVEAYLASGEILSAKERFNVDDFKDETFSGKWSNLGGNKEHHPVADKKHQLPYRLNWVSNIGSNIFMSSPVIHENNLFIASIDNGNAEKCFIVSYDVSTGKENWRYKTVNGVKNQMVIAGDLLVACDMQGITYALDVDGGRLQWKKEPPAHEVMGFVKGLVTDGKVVYTGSGKNLCALDVSTERSCGKMKPGVAGMEHPQP